MKRMPTMEIDLSFDATIATRFWAKVAVDQPDKCWHWTGSKNNLGYGTVGLRNGQGKMKPYKAHRISYALERGPITNGLCVLHKCDTPSCVNPDHLFLGTYTDNTQDKIAKGRHLNACRLSSIKNTGRRPSEATREKMRIAKLGAAHWRAKAVTINGVDYPCLRDAARALGVTETCVRKWVNKGKAQLKTEWVSPLTPLQSTAQPSQPLLS